MSWINAVNHFWFNELELDGWFRGEPRIDALIRERFADLRAELKKSPPSAGLLDANGLVAAVIVFDQFSRNLFRESSEAYATDTLALALACHAVDCEMDASLGLNQRQFLYMPFMHSENREMQVRSVRLFRRLGDPAPLGYAENHQAIIERFGRFPHRNGVLGRQSTAAEQEFLLNQPEYC
jgi:uncharacterized protein (DUF924 family)